MKRVIPVLAAAAVIMATAMSEPAEARGWRGGWGPGIGFGIAAGALAAGAYGAYGPYPYGYRYYGPSYAYYGGPYYGPRRYYRHYRRW